MYAYNSETVTAIGYAIRVYAGDTDQLRRQSLHQVGSPQGQRHTVIETWCESQALRHIPKQPQPWKPLPALLFLLFYQWCQASVWSKSKWFAKSIPEMAQTKHWQLSQRLPIRCWHLVPVKWSWILDTTRYISRLYFFELKRILKARIQWADLKQNVDLRVS